MINLSSFITSRALREPDRCAIRYGGSEISYGDFHDSIIRLGALLQQRGIGEGGAIALLMKNSAAYLQICFAISHIGGVVLPLNFRLSRDEIAHIVGDADARLLFVDDELAGNVPPGLASIVLDEGAQRDARNLVEGEAVARAVPRGTQDIFRLMYTSGTTSRPKGVIHSYENFYFKSADQVIALGLNRDTRLLICGPLYHVGAFDLPGVAVLWTGGSVSIERNFDAELVMATIERDRIEGIWLAPVMTGALLACHPGREYDLSSLRWVIAGGERTPEERVRQFADRFPEARYIDAYGLTESGGGDTFMDPGFELTKIGSTGRALAHVEVTIRDDEGRELPANDEGEICLRGPKVTKGYWNDPVKTRESFFGDWFRTGDVGYLDDDGFLFITDRKKDMILSGGENIASQEVERVIGLMPEVEDVAVIGLPDAQWGERPVAAVVLKQGTEMNIDSLSTHCRRHLAAYKVPRGLFIVGALPRNPSGKVLKKVLRQELSE